MRPKNLNKTFLSPASDCELLTTANLRLHWLHVCRHKFISANHKKFLKIRTKYKTYKILPQRGNLQGT